MKASLVFLNDAYQNSIELVKAVDEQPSNELEEFLDLFMTTRDLFIRQLVEIVIHLTIMTSKYKLKN